MKITAGFLAVFMCVSMGISLAASSAGADETKEPDCSAQILKILNSLGDYSRFGAISDRKKTDQIYQDLHETIFGPHDRGDDDACFQVSMRTYVLQSVIVDGTNPLHFMERSFSGKTPWVTEALKILLRHDKVVFLTREMRSSLGGKWSDKDASGYLSVSGYDCASSIIYIDPNLRPVDLSTTLIHEFDHLYRDKFTSLDSYPASFEENWEVINYVDELQAILSGGEKWSSMKATTSYETGVFKKHDHSGFDLVNDGTLYSGPIMTALIEGFKYSSDYFPMMVLGTGSAKDTGLMRKVQEAYFPNTKNRKLLDLDMDGLERYPRATIGFRSENALSFLEQSIDTRSNMCTSYMAAVDAGAVTTYLGLNYTGGSAEHRALYIRPCLKERF